MTTFEEVAQAAAAELAVLLASARLAVQGAPVDFRGRLNPDVTTPDGSHLPQPHEIKYAQLFIQGLLNEGWAPPVVINE